MAWCLAISYVTTEQRLRELPTTEEALMADRGPAGPEEANGIGDFKKNDGDRITLLADNSLRV